MADFVTVPILPVVTLSAVGNFKGTGAEFNLPVLTVFATLSSGIDAVFVLPSLQFTGAMLTGNAFAAAFLLPAVSAIAALRSNGLLTADFILPGPQLSAQILSGQLLATAPNLPVLTLAAALRSATQFTAAFQLPPVQLTASLLAVLAAGARTWALNTRRNALTEYDFEFTSYALFNGLVLGVSPAGVVVLGTQALDGATAITALVRTAKSNYGELHLKRTPRLYVQGDFAGDMLFRTVVDATGVRTYRMPHNHVTGFQQRRIPVGKGPKGVWWQYETENEGGADFTFEGVTAYPTLLRRRIM